MSNYVCIYHLLGDIGCLIVVVINMLMLPYGIFQTINFDCLHHPGAKAVSNEFADGYMF